MKLGACAAGAFLTFVGVVAACSSAPSQPPIDTSGSTTASGGGGTAPAGDSGSDGGAGFLVGDGAADAPNTCISGGCLGCCTTLNVCVAGNVSAACGVTGGPCQICQSTQSCINNFCQ